MKYCTNCGREMQDDQRFCPYCGTPHPTAVPNNTKTPAQNIQPAPKNNPKHSGLGITAFILSMIFFTAPVAIVLAIVDLAANKKNKHGLSVAALIIGAVNTIVLITFIIAMFSPSDTNGSKQEKATSSQTENQMFSEEIKKYNSGKYPYVTSDDLHVYFSTA